MVFESVDTGTGDAADNGWSPAGLCKCLGEALAPESALSIVQNCEQREFRCVLSAFSATREQFLNCDDPQAAFQLLDQLCEQLIEMSDGVLPEELQRPTEGVLQKVAEIDSYCEKQSAREIIQQGIDDLDHYPWNLRDYYEAERAFILNHVAETIGHVSVVGHGAIPHSALLFRDRSIELIDIDAEVSELARNIFDRFAGACEPRIRVADICADNIDVKSLPSQSGVASLAIVANAPLPFFLRRESPVPHDYVFLRSSTEKKGAALYPRTSLANVEEAGYEVIAWEADKIYGIHEWILCKQGSQLQDGRAGLHKDGS